MKEIEWQHPEDSEKGVLENHGQGKSFNDPIKDGDFVKLRSDGKFVQVCIKDAKDPQALIGEVALSNDVDALDSLGLETYDPVRFRKDQIFIRVFGG